MDEAAGAGPRGVGPVEPLEHPLLIGARDMAFPRMNALGFWVTLFGGLVLYFSFLVPGGAPAMGTFGHYEDELVRIEGRWKFKRRRIVNEFLEGRQAGPVNPVRSMGAGA